MNTGAAKALAGALLILHSVAFAQDDEPLEPPTAKLEISVEQEVYGQCANVAVGVRGQAPLVRWSNVCHGWRTFSCGDRLLLVALGIREDQAILIFEGKDRTGDPMALITKEIARKWPGNEILDLSFGDARCEDGAFLLPFDGSYAPSKGGSGHAMKGQIAFRGPDDATINIRP